jgi:hypothetical protein
MCLRSTETSKELSLQCLDGILFQIGQDEEPFVGHRESGIGVRHIGAAARTGSSINGTLLQIGQPRVLEKGQQRHECCWREAGH